MSSKNLNLTHADPNQIAVRSFDGDKDAVRVSIISGEMPKFQLDTESLIQSIRDGMKNIKIDVSEFKMQQMPWGHPLDLPQVQPAQVSEPRIIEVPRIVREIEYREVEKPIIVKEVEIKEVIKEVPLYIEKIVEVEKPIIIEREKFIQVSGLTKAFFAIQGLIMIGLLIVNLIKK